MKAVLTRLAQHSEADVVLQLSDSSGDDVDPDATPTVTITRQDGTALVEDEDATDLAGTGAWGYTLTPTHTAQLDLLTATWKGELGGGAEQTWTTYHQVVGSHLFTLPQLRQLDPLQDEDTYTDAECLYARDLASAAIEQACGVAFSRQHAVETVVGTGTHRLAIGKANPADVSAIAVDGTALTADQLDDVLPHQAGVLYRFGAVWPDGARIAVTYTHGHQVPPARIGRAAMLLARHYLFMDSDSGMPDRATSLSTDHGTFDLVTAGTLSGGGLGLVPTDLPEVNAAIAQYAV